jgi:hypothetical protein
MNGDHDLNEASERVGGIVSTYPEHFYFMKQNQIISI